MGGLNASVYSSSIIEFEGGERVGYFACVFMLRVEQSCPTLRVGICRHHHTDEVRFS